MTGWFSAAEFKRCYLAMFPSRAEGSILPADHVRDHYPKGKERHGKFLQWDRTRGEYRFVGLPAGQAADTNDSTPIREVEHGAARHWPPQEWRAELQRLNGSQVAASYDRIHAVALRAR